MCGVFPQQKEHPHIGGGQPWVEDNCGREDMLGWNTAYCRMEDMLGLRTTVYCRREDTLGWRRTVNCRRQDMPG